MKNCLVALLGGIGSGKSTVGRLLEERGAFVIDADSLGHEALEGQAQSSIALRWPSVIRDGSVDRAALAEIVFADARELRELEAITHPLIGCRIDELVEESTADLVVVELPLLGGLLEGRWLRVVVDASSEARINRLVVRGLSKTDAKARMRQQPPREAWLEVADFVVDNSGAEEELVAEVDNLIEFLDECAQLEANTWRLSPDRHD